MLLSFFFFFLLCFPMAPLLPASVVLALSLLLLLLCWHCHTFIDLASMLTFLALEIVHVLVLCIGWRRISVEKIGRLSTDWSTVEPSRGTSGSISWESSQELQLGPTKGTTVSWLGMAKHGT